MQIVISSTIDRNKQVMMKSAFNRCMWMKPALGWIVLMVCAGQLTAQKPTGQWLRVQTGEDYRIEINRTSGSFDENGYVTATYRTIFDQAQTVEDKSRTTYRVREDRIQFDTTGRYRFVNTDFLDSNEKSVATPRPDIGWRQMKSKTSRKLFDAAIQLPPFGYWRIITYRYASGERASATDPPELKKLIGSEMQLEYSGVRVGETACEKPRFHGKSISTSEFEKLFGSSPVSIGLPNEDINALLIACGPRPDSQTRSFILRVPHEKGLMLWDGVFLEVQRIGKLFTP